MSGRRVVEMKPAGSAEPKGPGPHVATTRTKLCRHSLPPVEVPSRGSLGLHIEGVTADIKPPAPDRRSGLSPELSVLPGDGLVRRRPRLVVTGGRTTAPHPLARTSAGSSHSSGPPHGPRMTRTRPSPAPRPPPGRFACRAHDASHDGHPLCSAGRPAAACHRPGFLFGGVPLHTRVRRWRALPVALVVCLSIAVSVLAGCSSRSERAPTRAQLGTGTASRPSARRRRPPLRRPRARRPPGPSPARSAAPCTTRSTEAPPPRRSTPSPVARAVGTAVTHVREGTHTVRLECAARDGDTWALGGTTEQTTVHTGRLRRPGRRSSSRTARPSRSRIWLSADPAAGSDCEGLFLTVQSSQQSSTLGGFSPVESGKLVPPA